MLAAGYMAKKVEGRPHWLKAAGVEDVCSVSGCISEYFCDYIPHWKHNGFWFFDPVGGYSRRILHNHATSMGFGPPSATRACHMPLNFVTNPLPQNVLLNVRVRSLVNGVYSQFGPACRFNRLLK